MPPSRGLYIFSASPSRGLPPELTIEHGYSATAMNITSIKPIKLVVVILLILSSHMASPLHVLPGEKTLLSPGGKKHKRPPPGRSLYAKRHKWLESRLVPY